jgi:alkaline phosphatase D
VVVTRRVRLSLASDWTCRVLVGGLQSSTNYWFRFIDGRGAGSRIGRTMTAPDPADGRPVAFAFVSCQNANLGPLTAWRRMIFDDDRAAPADRLGFVLHLGDFVYDTLWYPEDRPDGYFDRRVRPILRYPDGERHDDFHVPTTLADYRALYRAYLHDPDLQDARARWPFVAIWDNGEYSDKGWQGLQYFEGRSRPAQTRKVAANQAWFEFIPARVATAHGSLDRFDAPSVRDAPVAVFDGVGLGREPNNEAAIDSLTGYRAQRWGRHVELMLTDQRSYRSEDYTQAPEAKAIASRRFTQMVPFETLRMIDAGRTWNGGRPSATLRFADGSAPNWRKDQPPRTLLGIRQREWLLSRLSASTATWKIWGDTVATFDMRADPQNLPSDLRAGWPDEDYAGFARTDHSTAYVERAMILNHVKEAGIGGFVTLSGDRHSFWAGYSAKDLPPRAFEPVGINFVTGSISSPGMVEALEHTFPKEHALRRLYLIDRPAREKPEAAVNLLLRHGVGSCLDYAEHGDLERAKARANPANAPHVRFVDMGGHGYGIVRADAERIDVEFVAVPRPVEAVEAHDGGPVRYRVVHGAALWRGGERPNLTTTSIEGDAQLSA